MKFAARRSGTASEHRFPVPWLAQRATPRGRRGPGRLARSAAVRHHLGPAGGLPLPRDTVRPGPERDSFAGSGLGDLRIRWDPESCFFSHLGAIAPCITCARSPPYPGSRRPTRTHKVAQAVRCLGRWSPRRGYRFRILERRPLSRYVPYTFYQQIPSGALMQGHQIRRGFDAFIRAATALYRRSRWLRSRPDRARGVPTLP